MPWIETTPMEQREEFVALARSEGANISLLCERFDVSRKTAYKWLARAGAEGAHWAREHSRRPLGHPLRTAPEMERRVLDVRAAHPAWGARKIRARLVLDGRGALPSASTITAILRRHGLIDPAQSRARGPMLRFEREAPNELWQMDFKGAVATARGACHPLTVVDDHSRFAIAVAACADERAASVRAALSAAMRRHGMPVRMLMDNGACWGRVEAAWTVLEVWLMRLGIAVSHGRPYHPQTQGKCERFNRTLKAEALAGRNFESLEACQPVFDRFRHSYNHERPHEALGGEVPASRYLVSRFSFSEALPAVEYLPGDTVRRVGPAGYLSFHKRHYQLGRAFKGQDVALRPLCRDGEWAVFYCGQCIARLSEREAHCEFTRHEQQPS